MNRTYIIYFIISLIIVSCKIGHHYEAQEITMPSGYLIGTNDTANVANLKWWEVYKDTLLVNYLNLAIENNQQLNIAIERVEEFKSLKRISESDLLPKINLFAEKEYEDYKISGIDNNNLLIGELSWELDLWGRIRWQREAGIADYLASQEDKNGSGKS